MIVAIIQIGVAELDRKDVRNALPNRQQPFDDPPGFLGMEVFTDIRDSSICRLMTRWTDRASFEGWRKRFGPLLSNTDASTVLNIETLDVDATIFERIAGDEGVTSWDEQAFDSISLMSRYLRESRTVHYLVASLDGTIRVFNDAAALHLKVPPSQLEGLKLWSYLTEDDACRLWLRVHSGARGTNEKLLINFIDAEHFPYTLECKLDVQPEYFTLIGELPEKEENVLREHLLQITNQLAVLTRENAQKSKALEKSNTELGKALRDLNTSYWHLRKISEYLPICMHCHKVRTAEACWESVADYLNKYSLFLTHSVCPPCYAAMMEDVSRIKKDEP